VAGQLDALPGVEVAVDLPAGLLHLGLQGLDFLGNVHPGRLGGGAEGVDLVSSSRRGFSNSRVKRALGADMGP
jgi:hypothetical protein